jgi:hypothetical protein
MTIAAAEGAVCDALGTYLRTQLVSIPALVDSDVRAKWPEPIEDLRLSSTRIVVAIIRGEQLGAPVLQRPIIGGTPRGRARFDAGQIDLPLTLGVWAYSGALRDDVDLLLDELLNVPYWSTIAPTARTTLARACTVGEEWVTPASMTDVWPGCMVRIDEGFDAEAVVVHSVRATSFETHRPMRRAHAAGVPIVEVRGRLAETAATGLHLRCAIASPMEGAGPVARFDFKRPQILDDIEEGRACQRQEWRSLRRGTGSVRLSRELAATLQQRVQIQRAT